MKLQRLSQTAVLAMLSVPALAQTIPLSSVPPWLSGCTNVPSASLASNTAIALSASAANTGTLGFQARFNPADWSGQLLAYPFSNGGGGGGGNCNSLPSGTPCSALWDASQTLNQQDSNTGRTILSDNPSTHIGIPFRWSSLGSAQQDALNANPASPSSADGYGSQRLDWLRGSRADEAIGSVPQFRSRSSVLGDIIDSNPFYVGAPTANYAFDGYATFRSLYANRLPMIYVGANDGMLHGFSAVDGSEHIAYVPAAAYGSKAAPLLSQLTRTDYSHLSFVDDSPTVADAWFGSSWHSVLAGGLGAGGPALYALDVTNPAQFTETNAAALLLWEFTAADDADLGDTYSQPAIVRTAAIDANGHNRWAVIIGNGYNSASGKAALFILFLDHHGTQWTSGTDYLKLVAASGTSSSNGLSTPASVDIDGDGIVDRIYAGDLQGHLWRFNVTGSDPSKWQLAYGGKPLFTATDFAQHPLPITGRPEVGYNLLTTATQDVTVYFGSGRYLSADDNAATGQATQAFFALFDEDWSSLPTIQRGNLQQQSILAESGAPGSGVRATSSNTVDPAQQYGWYLDLFNTAGGSVTEQQAAAGANHGERQISNPVLRDGNIVFTTLIPSTSPCQPGGGWLMELSAQAGTAPAQPTLDINHDGNVDAADVVSVIINGKTEQLPASGLQSTGGFLAAPAILTVNATQELKLVGGASGMTAVAEKSGGRVGRVAWREIQPN